MIGSLQRNKAKTSAGLFHCIQSLDRDELIDALGKAVSGPESPDAGKRPLPVLLELHTAEDSKSGYPDFDALLKAAEKTAAYPGLALAGLMTMAPFTGDKTAVRASFRSLYQAGEKLKQRGFFAASVEGATLPTGTALSAGPVLSMGMSGDFELAIEEGATLIRIGTLIFGERKP
jgi:uncharacterized pyridoxal phosphate-containing UPF0001 family protein